MDVGLVLTRACNLACGYCFAGEKKRVPMSREVGERAIDFALDAAVARGEPLEIELFGGEPLLEWELVVDLATLARRRASERGVPLVLQMTTNGTLLDDERVKVLGELEVHLALSLDGTQKAHDQARPNVGGAGSYRLASAALDRLLAAGRPFDVITVVDPATVTELARGVRETLDRGVSQLTLNANWAGAWTDAALESMRLAYEEVAAILVAWFRRGRAVSIQPFDSALVTFASSGSVRPHGCSAGVSSLAVGPSGRVYGCARSVGEDEAERAIGAIDAGLDPARVAVLGSPACPGSCACANLEETGDASTPGHVQRFHDALVASLAPKIARALERDAVGLSTYLSAFAPERAAPSVLEALEVS